MAEETKKIIDYLKRSNKNKFGFEQGKLINYEEAQLLLDYITNLQQENKRLKKDNKSYQEYPFIIIEKNGVICSKNQEIERLNNIINELEKYLENRNSFFKEMNRDYGTHHDLLDENENILDKLKELKESVNNE